MRFWIGSCLLPAALALGGCASDDQPMARAVEGSGSYEEAASVRRSGRGPKVPRLEPKTVRAFPESPVKPRWRGPTRSALDLNPEAQAEVETSQDHNAKEERRRIKVRRYAARRKRARARDRRASSKKLDAFLDREVARRAKLLVTRRAEWLKLKPKRVAAYLTEARRLAGGKKARAVELMRRSQELSKLAARQADASEQLRLEAAAEATRARRYAKATYLNGLRTPEARADAETAERRLTEISLIAAYGQLEAAWAREACRQSRLTWERFLAKNSR